MNDRTRPPAATGSGPSLPAAARDRERAVERLRAHYVRDDIDVDTYERMLDAAWSADSTADLDALFARLPALPESAAVTGAQGAPGPVAATASAAERKERGFQLALLGGSERKGSWVPPKKLFSLALMGGNGLDFREARLGPGVTQVTALAVWGGIEIIVPPGVTVQADGVGIMGGFDGHSQIVDTADPSAPVIRIRGLAVMGGVEVKMMHPGETGRDARRRVKEERRRRRLERHDR